MRIHCGLLMCWLALSACSSGARSAPGKLAADGGAGDAAVGAAGSSSNVMGATGGTVSSRDGKVTLTIPAGALAHSAKITISAANGAPAGSIGTAYEIGPTGTKFAKPVRLTLSYEDAMLNGNDPSTLVVATADGKGWQPISGFNSPSAHEVSAPLQHLSIYGIVPHAKVPACTCDRTCFTQSCSGVKGASFFSGTRMNGQPAVCQCIAPITLLSSPFNFFWGNDDGYKSCSGLPLVGGACTQCIKDCVRQYGGWISLADDQVCQATFGPVVATPGAPSLIVGPSLDTCVAACPATQPPLCKYSGGAMPGCAPIAETPRCTASGSVGAGAPSSPTPAPACPVPMCATANAAKECAAYPGSQFSQCTDNTNGYDAQCCFPTGAPICFAVSSGLGASGCVGSSSCPPPPPPPTCAQAVNPCAAYPGAKLTNCSNTASGWAGACCFDPGTPVCVTDSVTMRGATSSLGSPSPAPSPIPRCSDNTACSDVVGSTAQACIDTASGYTATCCMPLGLLPDPTVSGSGRSVGGTSSGGSVSGSVGSGGAGAGAAGTGAAGTSAAGAGGAGTGAAGAGGAAGTGAVDGGVPCGPNQHACGSACCTGSQQCTDSSAGTCVACGTRQPGCGAVCCPVGHTCTDASSGTCSACASSDIACGPTCCAAGQLCANATNGTCTTCGNGILQPNEQCDGTAFGRATCASLGFGSGTLRCNAATCTFDTSMCSAIPDGGAGGHGG